ALCPLALLGTAFYPVLVHRLAASLHASSPHSVALVQLRFTSFVVINLRRDLHPQEGAHAGRTKKGRPCRAPLVCRQSSAGNGVRIGRPAGFAAGIPFAMHGRLRLCRRSRFPRGARPGTTASCAGRRRRPVGRARFSGGAVGGWRVGHGDGAEVASPEIAQAPGPSAAARKSMKLRSAGAMYCRLAYTAKSVVASVRHSGSNSTSRPSARSSSTSQAGR
ncbi:hypothetical protein DFR41_1191, partial [Pseudacidovorax intermedius]